MCGSSKEISVQIHLPQWADRVDNQDIRVHIKDPFYIVRQQPRRQKSVIHFFGILLGNRRILKQLILHTNGKKGVIKCLTLLIELTKSRLWNPTVEQIEHYFLRRVIDMQRGKKDLKLGKIILVQCCKE